MWAVNRLTAFHMLDMCINIFQPQHANWGLDILFVLFGFATLILNQPTYLHSVHWIPRTILPSVHPPSTHLFPPPFHVMVTILLLFLLIKFFLHHNYPLIMFTHSINHFLSQNRARENACHFWVRPVWPGVEIKRSTNITIYSLKSNHSSFYWNRMFSK